MVEERPPTKKDQMKSQLDSIHRMAILQFCTSMLIEYPSNEYMTDVVKIFSLPSVALG